MHSSIFFGLFQFVRSKNMAKYRTVSVFTPTTPARLTFVPREDINDQLVDALITPGKQIVVYGPSGGGVRPLFF